MKACPVHKRVPVTILRSCPGCEVEALRRELQAWRDQFPGYVYQRADDSITLHAEVPPGGSACGDAGSEVSADAIHESGAVDATPMTTTFELRVLLPVVGGKRWELVGEPFPEYARNSAILALDEAEAGHPGWYFELLKVRRSEECLRFTPRA